MHISFWNIFFFFFLWNSVREEYSFCPDYLEMDSDHTSSYWYIQLLVACCKSLYLGIQTGIVLMDLPDHKWQILALLSLPKIAGRLLS